MIRPLFPYVEVTTRLALDQKYQIISLIYNL